MAAVQRNNWIVDARLNTPIATIDLMRCESIEPCESLVSGSETHNIVLSLTPRVRDTCVRYRDHWPAERFEPIGTLFLLPASEAMQFRSTGGRRVSIVCRLRADAVRSWFDVKEWSDHRLEASLDMTSPRIGELLRRLADEVRRPGLASEELAETIAVQLAIELGRYYTAIPERPVSGGLAPWRLQLIDERLADACATPTLAELAERCGLSVRQLTRGYRASRGVSIGDHVARVKIEAAKRMLADRASIGEVAHAMGFASPSAFSFAFKRSTGQTPRHFRHRTD